MSDFAGNSAKLAFESIRNSYLRAHYIEITQETANEIFENTKNAELLSPCQSHDIWKGAALKASNLRNSWMNQTRDKMSSTAVAFSRLIKSNAPTFVELVGRYSYRLFGEDTDGELSNLAEPKQIRVFKTIVQASGRTNTKINIMSKVFGYFGAVSLIMTFGFVLYGIEQSDAPVSCVIKFCVTFKAGLIGAYLGSSVSLKIGQAFSLATISTFLVSIFGGLIVGILAAILGAKSVTFIYLKLNIT